MTVEDRRSRPPLPRPLAWAARLGEAAYSAAIGRRNARFDSGVGVNRFAIPIISVGNLSVGGTGKTPMVSLIVRWLLEAGHRPAIVMRGYKSRAGAMSDEQAEYIERFGDAVPVAAHPDRTASIGALRARGACDVVVLDDGFQHRRVARDLDIVLLDASRDAFTDHLLPRGWLREPVSSLSRAHAVVLTRTSGVPRAAIRAMERRVAAAAPNAVIAEADHTWASVIDERTNQPVPLAGRAVLVASGIGHPGAFLEQARAAGAEVCGTITKPDHHRWTPAQAADLAAEAVRRRADAILIPMKDWVKLRDLIPPAGPAWLTPALELRIAAGEASLRALVSGVTG